MHHNGQSVLGGARVDGSFRVGVRKEDSLILSLSPPKTLLWNFSRNIYEMPDLGSEGVLGFMLNDMSLTHPFRKVRTYDLVDFALLDDGFRFPNVEHTDI